MEEVGLAREAAQKRPLSTTEIQNGTCAAAPKRHVYGVETPIVKPGHVVTKSAIAR